MQSNTFKRIIEFDISHIKDEELNSRGIYQIVNTINNHCYIGSASRTFKERFKEHCGYFANYLRNGGRLHTPILWNAFQKYGIKAFKINILEYCNNMSIPEILKREEFYINLYKPQYNVCTNPTKGGIPNKNRKLTQEWKDHIREKSKLYKHDANTLKIVTKNNRNNACKLKLTKDQDILFFNSWIELKKYFNIKSTYPETCYKLNKLYKGYHIEKIKSQQKKIELLDENNNIIITLNSFNECDKFLNMWRGYTSTQYIRNIKILKDKYRYNVL